MKKILAVVGLVAAVALVACGGGDDDAPKVTAVAPAAVTVNASSAVAAALKDEPFTFPTVSEFGTTASTSVAFTNTATNPGFSIGSNGFVASGDTAFGSCTFRIRTSSFPVGHPLSAGQEVRVDPCSIEILTANMAATGESLPKGVTMKLGRSISASRPISVSVSPTGELQIKGVTVITVPVTPVSGGS